MCAVVRCALCHSILIVGASSAPAQHVLKKYSSACPNSLFNQSYPTCASMVGVAHLPRPLTVPRPPPAICQITRRPGSRPTQGAQRRLAVAASDLHKEAVVVASNQLCEAGGKPERWASGMTGGREAGGGGAGDGGGGEE